LKRDRGGSRAPISRVLEEVVRPIRPRKQRSKPGKAIQAKWLTPHELAKLRTLIAMAKKAGDLLTWRRARAVWLHQ
jgi:hypothetical protein